MVTICKMNVNNKVATITQNAKSLDTVACNLLQSLLHRPEPDLEFLCLAWRQVYLWEEEIFLSVYQMETGQAIVAEDKDKRDKQDCSIGEANVCNSV